MFDNLPERMLPPKEHWPDLIFTGDHSNLIWNKESLNCADVLWDIGVVKNGREGKIAYYTDGEPVTYQELGDSINKFGNGLRDLGIQEGDRVVFRFGDYLEAIITEMAAWKIGAICVPCQTLERSHELEYIFNDTECSLVVSAPESIDELEKALENSPTVKHVVVVGKYKGNKPFIPFDQILDGKSIELTSAKTKPLDASGIYYTGGTTGKPKGCICTHAGEIAHALNVIEVRGTQKNDVHYCPLPVGHTFGNFEKVPNIIGAGSTSILNKERFSPKLVLETIQKYKVTKFIASPTVLRMISGRENPLEYDLSSLRTVICSGEVFDQKTFKEWTGILGFEPWNGFGGTPFRGWIIYPADRGKKIAPGTSIGKPLPGYEVRIVDKKGQDVSVGKTGNLLVRGATGISFLNNKHPDIKRYVKEDMAWGKYSRLDDVFYRDQDGWLYFESRESFLIRSAGRFIGPTEIEEALSKHPAVDEVVVVASPDQERGEVPKAFIVLGKGYDSSDKLVKELQASVKSKISPYKYPRKIEFVSEIPKDGVGKIQRKVLKEREFKTAE